MKHVAIIGNGISGITAARQVRKFQPDYRITVISAESDHFYSRPALMYIYMGHMTYENTKPYEDFFWEKNRIDLVRGFVHQIDPDGKALHLSTGQVIGYDALVLAVGSTSNRFGWPGQELPGVQGLVNLQDLAEMEQNTKDIEHAVIVGGGLIGVEMAEMLHARHIPVTFLVREERYMNRILPPEEADMVGHHILAHGIDLRLSTELKEILPGPDGRVRAVITSEGDEVPCQFVGLTAGVRPNIEVVRDSTIETGRGILINEYFETSAPDVYAIGDCAEFREALPGRRNLEQLWYTGRMHGATVAHTICGQRRAYNPGVFFNSAKFFDIEYQTYGDVVGTLPEGEETLFWQHPTTNHSIRINYRATDQQVTGFVTMGIRYRHQLCEQWLQDNASLRDVLENLGAANFDPEFFPQFEAELVRVYNQNHPDAPLALKRKRGLFAGMFRKAS